MLAVFLFALATLVIAGVLAAGDKGTFKWFLAISIVAIAVAAAIS